MEQNDKTVVSVFVNPMQFGPTEDLESYPRDLDADAKLCEETGADVIFHPEPEEMYRPGFCSYVNMTGLPDALCGLTRPVHFKGVCTVVNKLFNIVQPDRAYFGQKDAQQLAIIMRMVTDLNMDIEIVGCPIVKGTGWTCKKFQKYLPDKRRTSGCCCVKQGCKSWKRDDRTRGAGCACSRCCNERADFRRTACGY